MVIVKNDEIGVKQFGSLMGEIMEATDIMGREL